ncbi:MAG: hypothetical protein PHD31_01350 [Candidatus Pacebacteria bacterium]|nr:hypothetical protein [Candidatus Paceibacterota bacterium]
MLTKITSFVKKFEKEIVLIITIILISTLAFFLGYIYSRIQEKEPIRIEQGSFI